MKTLPWRHIFAGLLSAFFIVGGAVNLFAPPEILQDYQTWGYPDWFHYVTGALEWSAAVLMAIPLTRLAGSILAAAIMTAAAATVLSHGEYVHGLQPLIVLVLVCLNGWLTWRAGRSRRAS